MRDLNQRGLYLYSPPCRAVQYKDAPKDVWRVKLPQEKIRVRQVFGKLIVVPTGPCYNININNKLLLTFTHTHKFKDRKQMAANAVSVSNEGSSVALKLLKNMAKATSDSSKQG